VRLVDSHCHIQADRFDADADLVLGAARLAGLERLLVPGWDRASSERAIALAARMPWLDAAVGVHPHEAARIDDADWSWFVQAARDPRVVAIGETGLDFDRAFSSRPDQLSNLRRNLSLALATGKPAILHCRSAVGRRDAQDALVDELRAAGFGGPAAAASFGGRPPAIVHSFSGPLDYAETMLGLGCAISFSGLVFRPGEEASATVVAHVPAGRLLVETDSPYLSPPGAPRRRNEPAFVALTAAWVAERRDVTPEALGGDLVAAYDAIMQRDRGGPRP
jgi:TatD DNase family protein